MGPPSTFAAEPSSTDEHQGRDEEHSEEIRRPVSAQRQSDASSEDERPDQDFDARV